MEAVAVLAAAGVWCIAAGPAQGQTPVLRGDFEFLFKWDVGDSPPAGTDAFWGQVTPDLNVPFSEIPASGPTLVGGEGPNLFDLVVPAPPASHHFYVAYVPLE